MTISDFGITAQGQFVQVLHLGQPGGLQVILLTYGAILHSIRLPGRTGMVEALRGYPDLAAYETDRGYHGPVVGRYANRIGGARFAIDGMPYTVTANEGPNCLHGGATGFGKRIWAIDDHSAERARLSYTSPAGEEGFPGSVHVTVSLTVEANRLTLTYGAQTTAPTPLNLCHHPYFNLSGRADGTILDHWLQIDADATTEVDGALIPTGRLLPVKGTPCDLRQARPIGEAIAGDNPQLNIVQAREGKPGFDFNWVLNRTASPQLRLQGEALTMTAITDQPGLQLYSGQGLASPFVPYGGLVIEPQDFPDAPNRPEFPNTILRAGQNYYRTTQYAFAPS